MSRKLIVLYSPEKDRYEKKMPNKWRPTIDLIRNFQPSDTTIIYQKKHNSTKDVSRLLKEVQKEYTVHKVEVEYANPHDISSVAAVLYPLIQQEATADTKTYIHTTIGTFAMRSVLLSFITNTPTCTEIQSWQVNGAFGGFKIIEKGNRVTDAEESPYSEAEIRSIFQAQGGSLLITGETGTGKSHYVRTLAEELKMEYIHVNCAQFASNPQLAQSALFGHKKGAFSGAVNDYKGYLSSADRKILFLDEIGELDLATQALLLTAIETGRFRALGSEEETLSQFHLISATNKNLFREIERGTFREDLLHRISLVRREISSLRQLPKEEWSSVVIGMINLVNSADFEKNEPKVTKWSDDALQLYCEFASSKTSLWKANYRDLRDSVKRLTLLSGGNIQRAHVEREIKELAYRWGNFSENNAASRFPLSLQHISQEVFHSLEHIKKIELEEFLSLCATSKSMSDAGKKIYAPKEDVNFSDLVKKFLDRYSIKFSSLKESVK